jgi:hypothetical protein
MNGNILLILVNLQREVRRHCASCALVCPIVVIAIEAVAIAVIGIGIIIIVIAVVLLLVVVEVAYT